MGKDPELDSESWPWPHSRSSSFTEADGGQSLRGMERGWLDGLDDEKTAHLRLLLVFHGHNIRSEA